jgi:hypothetical protein
MTDAITIRRSTLEDSRRIRRLAELDSAEAPEGDVLLAEVDGELVAAVADDGSALADPFVPTAEVVGLLRRMAGRRPTSRRRLHVAF